MLITMQRNKVQFLVSDLPQISSTKLISSYFSLFGQVESCTYSAVTSSAIVEFSASDDTSHILNVRHRFMGSPIRVSRAVPSPETESVLSQDSCAPLMSSSVAPAPVDSSMSSISHQPATSVIKSHPPPPGTSLTVCFVISFPNLITFCFQINFVI